MGVWATASAISVPFSTQSQQFVDGFAGTVCQNRNYPGLAEVGTET